MGTAVGCPCGVDHSRASPEACRYVARLVAKLGSTMVVSTAGGSWRVPRIWIGIHGLRTEDLHALAERYGWEKLP